MIFCITGNAHQPFNRLIDLAVDLSRILNEELLIQNSTCIYSQAPKSEQTGVLNHQDFINTLCRASFVVAHAGAGTLRTLNTYKKKSICVPRLHVYGEHVNDHQNQIATAFMERKLTYIPQDYLCANISALNAYNQFEEMDFCFASLSDENLNDTIVSIVRDIIGR